MSSLVCASPHGRCLRETCSRSRRQSSVVKTSLFSCPCPACVGSACYHHPLSSVCHLHTPFLFIFYTIHPSFLWISSTHIYPHLTILSVPIRSYHANLDFRHWSYFQTSSDDIPHLFFKLHNKSSNKLDIFLSNIVASK